MFVSEIMKFFGHEKSYQTIAFLKWFLCNNFHAKKMSSKNRNYSIFQNFDAKKMLSKIPNYHIFNFKNSTKDKENVIKNPSLSHFQQIRRKYWKKKIYTKYQLQSFTILLSDFVWYYGKMSRPQSTTTSQVETHRKFSLLSRACFTGGFLGLTTESGGEGVMIIEL